MQKKYYFSFKGITNKNYTVEIWQNTTGLTATEIKGLATPFVVNYPELTNKFEAVRGSGCQINLLSETDMQFLNLYTSDIQEYQIRFFNDTDLMWCGFLDSEIYEEPFHSISNYPVSVSGNDGFALLNRFNYLDESGNNFTGLTSQFDILKFIFRKINLPFTSYNIGLSTTISGTTYNADETIFHKTFAMNSNFYNEDGDAETLRTVLESILQPLGAFIQQRNGNIYITDIQSIMEASLAWPYEIQMKTYVGTGLTYSGNNDLPVNIGDLSSIKFANSEQQLTVNSGINKQIVKYSPYRNSELLNFSAENDSYLYQTTSITYGATDFRWQETFYNSGTTFTRTPVRGFFVEMEGLDLINKDVKDSYLKLDNSVNQSYYLPASTGYAKGYTSFTSKYNFASLVSNNSDYSIKIEMQIYPQFLNNLNDESETSGKDIKRILQFCDIIIGDKHYNYVNYYNPTFSKAEWIDIVNTGFTTLNFYDGSVSSVVPELGNMADKWTDLQKYSYIWNGADKVTQTNAIVIPLDSTLNGDFQFNIYGYSCYSAHEEMGGIWFYDYEYCNNLRIKDIKLTIVDALGNEVEQSDIEYVGYMQKEFKNEGENIDLIQGTNITDFPTERGGLIGYDSGYYFLKKWLRNGIYDNIENLLLRSYIGNYKDKSIQLSCTTNRIDCIGFITYNNYLAGHTFMPVSLNIDYEEETSELVLQEIFADSLTINKSFN